MKAKTWGAILLSASALWWFVLRGILALKYRFADWRIQTLTTEDIAINLTFQVKNTLLISIPIDKIEGDIYSQDVLLGYVDMPISVNLRSGEIAEFPLILNINYRKVGEAIWRNIQSGDIKTLKLRFQGRVYSGLRSVAINKTLYFNDIFY